jgi:LacI family transcriptional regulator, repressor for deo operon, udp, cdd, tsx, nupC, and nupG
MEKKIPTIKEIAKRLNISVSTVSRALHDHPSIGLRTRTEVKKMASELNYEPNQAAISFKKGQSFTIGLIVPNLREEFFSAAINGVESVSMQNNYIVLIGQSHDEMQQEQKLLETMRKHRVDGILASIAKSTDHFDHFEQMKEYGTPVVFFDRIPDMPDIHFVRSNLYDGSVEAVELLIQQGHQHIGYIQGPSTLSNGRLEGYHAALNKHNIAIDGSLIVSTDLSEISTQQAFDQLMDQSPRPTAILAFNDYVALDAIQYARKKKMTINKDISFVSYANVPITRYVDYPPLASVEQFPYDQGEQATKLLLKLIDQKNSLPEVPPENIILKSKLIIR